MRVRGTQKKINTTEVNIDTVYIRTNIERIEEEEFTGWEYDEIQYPKNEYLEMLTNKEDTDGIAFLLSLMMAEIDMLRAEIDLLKGGA